MFALTIIAANFANNNVVHEMDYYIRQPRVCVCVPYTQVIYPRKEVNGVCERMLYACCTKIDCN